MIAVTQTVYPERADLMERRDCTVRALAACTGWKYLEAHRYARQHGRRHSHGIDPTAMVASLREKGFAVRSIPVEQPTFVRRTNLVYGTTRCSRRGGVSVETFLRRLPKQGSFYICTTRHAFAYVNGQVLDVGRLQGRAKMELAWEISKEEPKQIAPTQSQINELWARLDRLEGRV